MIHKYLLYVPFLAKDRNIMEEEARFQFCKNGDAIPSDKCRKRSCIRVTRENITIKIWNRHNFNESK